MRFLKQRQIARSASLDPQKYIINEWGLSSCFLASSRRVDMNEEQRVRVGMPSCSRACCLPVQLARVAHAGGALPSPHRARMARSRLPQPAKRGLSQRRSRCFSVSVFQCFTVPRASSLFQTAERYRRETLYTIALYEYIHAAHNGELAALCTYNQKI